MTEELTDEQKISVLNKLVMRTQWGDSGELPLHGPTGQDYSFDGQYWVCFREASGEALSKLTFASDVELVRRDFETGEEIVERRRDMFRMLEALVDLRLIKDARLPSLRDDGSVEATPWPKDTHEQRRWLKRVPPLLMAALLGMVNEFYLFEPAEAQVVEEVKNLPTRPELNLAEAEEVPSST